MTIRFSVRDIALREAFDEVIVIKRSTGGSTPPPAILGYNIYLLIRGLGITALILITTRKKYR